MDSKDIQTLAKNLVNYSTHLQKGEKVLIEGMPVISLYYKLTNQKPLFTKMVLDTINEKRQFSNKYAKNDLNLKETNLEELVYKTNQWFLEYKNKKIVKK